MQKSNQSSVSKVDTLEKMGEFWDTHDFTDFDTDSPDAEFTIASTVSIEPDILSAVERQARQRGIQAETLINLWLQEKLLAQEPKIAA